MRWKRKGEYKENVEIMKIRTDFVTNSSSVSYIIMMDLEILDCFLDLRSSLQSESEPVIMAKALRAFMLEKGTLSYVENHEIYTYLMKFRDDDDDAYSKQILQENGMNTDVSTMTEKELFNYLRGEYLLGGRLSRMMQGLAAIQVEQY